MNIDCDLRCVISAWLFIILMDMVQQVIIMMHGGEKQLTDGLMLVDSAEEFEL